MHNKSLAKAIELLREVKARPPITYVDEEDDTGECAWCYERSYLEHRDDCLYKQIVDYLS